MESEKMDIQQINEPINRCKHLKHQFRGIFIANLAFRTILKRDKTFMIVNASKSDQPGTHALKLVVKFFLQILLGKDYTTIQMFTNT